MPQFDIQHAAIHFVRKKDPEFSLAEVDFASYAPDDQKIIRDFLSEHLARAWEAEVSGKTRAANFANTQPVFSVQGAYQTLVKDSSKFFQISVKLARLLHGESPVNASPGLLLVLWFSPSDEPGSFLGLFKLEPGEYDQVALKRSEPGRFLLDLAVERIQWALPEPDRVLKWALIPHPPTPPDEPQFELKIRDQQSHTDPADYFTQKFLGCGPRPNARQQLEAVFEVLGTHAAKYHPGTSWKPGIEPLVQALGEERKITTASVVRQAKAHVLPALDEDAFLKELEASRAAGMRASPALIQRIKLRYELPGDIRIEGPLAAMATIVIDERADGSVEFRIPTTSNYRTKVIV